MDWGYNDRLQAQAQAQALVRRPGSAGCGGRCCGLTRTGSRRRPRPRRLPSAIPAVYPGES